MADLVSHLMSSALVSNTADIANTLKDAVTINSSSESPVVTEFGESDKRIFKNFIHSEEKTQHHTMRLDRRIAAALGEQVVSLKQIAKYLSPLEQKRQMDYLASRMSNFGAGTVNSPVVPSLYDAASLIPDLFGSSNEKPKKTKLPNEKPGMFKRFGKFFKGKTGKLAGLLGIGALIDGAATAYSPDIINQGQGTTSGTEPQPDAESERANKEKVSESERAKGTSNASEPTANKTNINSNSNSNSSTETPEAKAKTKPITNEIHTATSSTVETNTVNNNSELRTNNTSTETSSNTNTIERERVNTVNERLGTNIPEAKAGLSTTTAVNAAEDVAETAGKTSILSKLGKGFGHALGLVANVATAIPDVIDTVSVFNDASATNEDKGKSAGGTTGKIVGGLAGGGLGGTIGSTIGAGVGMLFGGVGAVPLSIAGGFIGSAVGSWLGSEGGEEVGKDIGIAVAKQLPDDSKEGAAATATPSPEQVKASTADSTNATVTNVQTNIPALSASMIASSVVPSSKATEPHQVGVLNQVPQPIKEQPSANSSSSSSSISTVAPINTNYNDSYLKVNNVNGGYTNLPVINNVNSVTSSTKDLASQYKYKAESESEYTATAAVQPLITPTNTNISDTDASSNQSSVSSQSFIDKSLSVVSSLAALPVVSSLVSFISKYNPLSLGSTLGKEVGSAATANSTTMPIGTETTSAVQPYLTDKPNVNVESGNSVTNTIMETLAKTSPIGAAVAMSAPLASLVSDSLAPVINNVSSVFAPVSNLGKSVATAMGFDNVSNPNVAYSSSSNSSLFSTSSNSNSSSSSNSRSSFNSRDLYADFAAPAYAPPVRSTDFSRESYVEPASSTDMVQLDKTIKETVIVKEQQQTTAPVTSSMQRDVSINLNNTPMVANDLGLLIINSGVV